MLLWLDGVFTEPYGTSISCQLPVEIRKGIEVSTCVMCGCDLLIYSAINQSRGDLKANCLMDRQGMDSTRTIEMDKDRRETLFIRVILTRGFMLSKLRYRKAAYM